MSSIIKVNNIQDGGGNSIVSSNGSGTFTPGSAMATGVLANTPAFCAVKSSQTTGQSDNTWTKITFDTEELDSAGAFASNAFTPGVAGEYFLHLVASGGTSAASSVTSIAIKIYKNGAEVTGVNNTSKTEDEVELFTISTSAIISADTDDYFEAYIKIDKSSNTNRVTTAQFMGYKLIGA